MKNEPIPERLVRSRHPSQPDLMGKLGFQAGGICDKKKEPAKLLPSQASLDQEVSLPDE